MLRGELWTGNTSTVLRFVSNLSQELKILDIVTLSVHSADCQVLQKTDGPTLCPVKK